MKVIAIMGSPHKGNGYKIVQKIEAELKLINDIDFKYIFLSDINFYMCKGCFTCISKGEWFCPLKDDKESIEQEILNSDGVILSSPGYALNVSGLMKNFIDRFAHSLHRPKFFKQSLMLVANGGSGLNKVIKALSITLGGSRKICELSITSTPWEANKKYEKKIEKHIKSATRKFYNSMKYRKETSPPLGNLIWFKIFKKMASISKETLPADYKYYSDKKVYFYETKVNPLKNCIADIISSIGVWSMKKRIIFK
ncbi:MULTISPECIES: flavodoxin family protein [unclassified Clostridium]|uniref:flavodoxin family protein n=1 Tax=unclassified Clostridium TaxID=2614128 RepID=UPI0025BD9558|nr:MULTISPECIES: flavodoxin family protein [unclassified Clostridium]